MRQLRFAAVFLVAVPFVAPGEEIQLRNWDAPPYWSGRTTAETPAGDLPGVRLRDGRQALAAGPTALPFIALPPCRVVDTRGNAPLTGGFLPAATVRSYAVTGICGIPSTAQALSLNATVVKPTGPGFLVLYPQGTRRAGRFRRSPR
jgi:hypothetical protein